MRSFMRSSALQKLLWCLFFVQIHVFFMNGGGKMLVGAFSPKSTAAAATPMGCPYKATKAFIGRQTAYLAHSLLSRSSASSSSLSMYYQSNDVAAGSHQQVLPSPFGHVELGSSLLSMQHKSRHMYHSRLYATTMTPSSAATSMSADNERDTSSSGQQPEKKKRKRTSDALEVICLGLSHHNAPVEVREKLAIPEADWNIASNALVEYDSIAEATVLSTCNRFEMYISGQNQYECIRDAVDFLEKRAGGTLDQAQLRKSLFMLSGEDAIWHLLRVSAGLDSLIVGEGQILAQVKRCYERGVEEGGQGGKVVSRMLNTAVSAGKRVRSETGISKGAVSISSAAAEFVEMKISADCGIMSGLEGANVCIIGAGKMARLLLVHLQTQGVKKVTMVNRSPDRVLELQKEFPDMVLELELMDKMWDVIKNSDVVFPSTAATTTIIDPEPLAAALEGRNRPGGIQFVDISVPRNVHPDCGQVPGVFSYNVDDLKLVVERNTAKRRREMVEAEGILREELSKYRLWQQSLGAIPTIAKLQEKAETLRLEELQKANKKLSNLSAKDLEAVERLSKGIVAKLLHGPMNHLRQQKEGDATRAAIEQVQQAFQLD